MLKDLVAGCRSYRRLCEAHAMNSETLQEVVDLASLAASGHNAQPQKYLLSR